MDAKKMERKMNKIQTHSDHNENMGRIGVEKKTATKKTEGGRYRVRKCEQERSKKGNLIREKRFESLCC